MAPDGRYRQGRLTRLSHHDTIVALSSGRPPAAIGVVRLSGPDALTAATALVGRLPSPRRAALRTVRDGTEELDRALVIAFPGPTSATGEDLVELHCHGGRAIVGAVVAALCAQPGVRAAAPGEFTRRALLNGRIDLAEAEGLADLLAAETQTQRRAAQHGADGLLSRRVHGWLDRLSLLAAAVEVTIDYADEDEGEETVPHAPIAALAAELHAALAAPSSQRLRDGVRIVVAGPPNAGKSSLVNALAGRAVAIVSPISGTTRDRIEAPVAHAGIPFVLCDTAGLTDSADVIEAAGVDLARDAIAAADVVLWMGDDAAPAGAIALHARADLPDRMAVPPGRLAVSTRSGSGLEELWARLDRAASALLPGDEVALNERQHDLLAQAAAATQAAADMGDPLLVAEHLRLSHRALAAITGADATEAMLDALFGRFCLGK